MIKFLKIKANRYMKTSILNLFKDVYQILSKFQIQDKTISINSTTIKVTAYEIYLLFVFSKIIMLSL